MRNITRVYNVVNDINATITENVKARMTRQRLTFMTLKNEEVDLEPFDIRLGDDRVWTRGDGVRYKDPGYIRVQNHRMYRLQRQYSSFKTLHPNEQGLLDYLWQTLLEMPGAKEVGTLSGCFQSDEHRPALTAGGLLWVRRWYGIEYGSISRTKGAAWNLTPPTEKETI